MTFSPSTLLTVLFVALVAVVVGTWLLVGVRGVFVRARVSTPTAIAAIAGWLMLHSVVVAVMPMPPPVAAVMPYFVLTMAAGALLVFRSKIGTALVASPLWLLVLLQWFRLPLELILHELVNEKAIPVEMSWQGRNFDVIVGATAPIVAVLLHRFPSRALALAWNAMGTALLINVGATAILSLPLPIRQFDSGIPMLMPLHLPYHWIVSVMVWTALVCHLALWRKLLTKA